VKVLVVAAFPPRHDAVHGGARWDAGLVTGLARSHDIGLLALRARHEEPIDERVAATCAFAVEIARDSVRDSAATVWRERRRVAAAVAGAPGWVVGHSVRRLRTELERVVASWQPDLVHFDSAVLAQYASCARPRPVVVVDLDPADGSAAMRRYRARTLSLADAVVALTERDRALLASLLPSTRVERIPLAVDIPAEPLDPSGNGRDVLFVGNFAHPPNVAAAAALVDEIFPRVAAVRADARLVIVGADPPERLLAHASETILVTGRVADVLPFLDQAAVVVAPLEAGGGMRLKVLEALAAGKALVASPRAVEGIELHDGESAVVDGGAAEFAAAILDLLGDERRRTALAQGGRAAAVERLGWTPVLAAYDALYRSLRR